MATVKLDVYDPSKSRGRKKLTDMDLPGCSTLPEAVAELARILESSDLEGSGAVLCRAVIDVEVSRG